MPGAVEEVDPRLPLLAMVRQGRHHVVSVAGFLCLVFFKKAAIFRSLFFFFLRQAFYVCFFQEGGLVVSGFLRKAGLLCLSIFSKAGFRLL